MFTEPIRLQALRQPRAIAVSLASRDVSYATFDGDINRMAHRLRPLIPAGARVAVSLTETYSHWLAILALGRLGAVSVSALREGPRRWAEPDIVLANGPLAEEGVGKILELSQTWIAETLASDRADPLDSEPTAEQPARIIPSAFAERRKILLTHAAIVRRIKAGVLGYIMECPSKVACQLGIETAAGFFLPLNVWWFGGSAGFFPLEHRALQSRQVDRLVVSPGRLASFLDELPPDSARLERLGVRVPAQLPGAVVEDTLRKLSPDLTTEFGFAETGPIAVCPSRLRASDPQTFGFVIPGVEVEIVGARGEVLAPDVPGNVRVRRFEMADTYLADGSPNESGRSGWRDGWFYPGVRGSLSAAGLLKRTRAPAESALFQFKPLDR
jgi:acyl-CoA synthetase (AMP-forming)/AMP-acid ligase II